MKGMVVISDRVGFGCDGKILQRVLLNRDWVVVVDSIKVVTLFFFF